MTALARFAPTAALIALALPAFAAPATANQAVVHAPVCPLPAVELPGGTYATSGEHTTVTVAPFSWTRRR